MVQRLARGPFKAEMRVRFPLALPILEKTCTKLAPFGAARFFILFCLPVVSGASELRDRGYVVEKGNSHSSRKRSRGEWPSGEMQSYGGECPQLHCEADIAKTQQ